MGTLSRENSDEKKMLRRDYPDGVEISSSPDGNLLSLLVADAVEVRVIYELEAAISLLLPGSFFVNLLL